MILNKTEEEVVELPVASDVRGISVRWAFLIFIFNINLDGHAPYILDLERFYCYSETLAVYGNLTFLEKKSKIVSCICRSPMAAILASFSKRILM